MCFCPSNKVLSPPEEKAFLEGIRRSFCREIAAARDQAVQISREIVLYLLGFGLVALKQEVSVRFTQESLNSKSVLSLS